MAKCFGCSTLRRCFLISAFTVAAYGIMAQPKAIASLKPERVETGDTVTLFILVSGLESKPKSVDFASWATVFPKSNITQRTDWRRSGTQWVQQFRLIAFDSAQLALPALKVLLTIGNPLTTNTLSLTVFPTSGKAISEMAPIRDVYREPVSWFDYWPWGLLVLTIIGCLAWLSRYYLRRPPIVKAPEEIQPTPISASETALKKLSKLQQQRLWETGQLKTHYAELSMIIREYLESKYHIAALESTTLEILALLATSDFPANQVPMLRDLLQKTDLVKYAQSAPPPAAHEALLEHGRELVANNYQQQQVSQSIPKKNRTTQKQIPGNDEPLL